jgi:Glycosyltransferase 61
MQQLYRCWSWWLANRDKRPVLLFPSHENVHKKKFISGFLTVLSNRKTIGLSVVAKHRGPVVRAKNTGKWLKDIELTDFAMIDPTKQLRKLFISQIPKVNAPGCSSKTHLPKIAILNRNLQSGRHLLNAQELALSIEATFPEIQPVLVATFENSDFIEQVKFFAEADIVISPHGAQLTGIAFMPECGSVLEFFPRHYLVPDYFGSLAKAAGLNHSFFYLDDDAAIPHDVRFHRFNASKFKSDSQCPPMLEVIAAVTQMVQDWHQCCVNSLLLQKSETANRKGPVIDTISTGDATLLAPEILASLAAFAMVMLVCYSGLRRRLLNVVGSDDKHATVLQL